MNENQPELNGDSSETFIQPVKKSPLNKILITVLGILVIGVIGFVIVKQNVRPDFDADAHAPVIEHPSELDGEAAERRGGFTDMFLDHPIKDADHPLDPALLVAKAGLEHFRKTVKDYTATVAKHERVAGKLLEKEYFECKIRQPRNENDRAIPLSFYLKFVNPKQIAGREVIWVDGWNNNRLAAHEGGLLGLIRVNLKPTSALAMRGNRYPITELGLETLIVRMIEKGERDRKLGNCLVDVDREIRIGGHKGTLITITHPEQSDEFEFYQAKIYIDDELNLPVGYEGFLWPDEPNGKPKLLESYFYSDLKINTGLDDADFDPDNPEYKFP